MFNYIIWYQTYLRIIVSVLIEGYRKWWKFNRFSIYINSINDMFVCYSSQISHFFTNMFWYLQNLLLSIERNSHIIFLLCNCAICAFVQAQCNKSISRLIAKQTNIESLSWGYRKSKSFICHKNLGIKM